MVNHTFLVFFIFVQLLFLVIHVCEDLNIWCICFFFADLVVFNKYYTYLSSPTVWKDPPSALTQSPKESKTVVFHAVLPTDLWEWDNDSEVYIRFGHRNLGAWHCDCGPMTIVKYVVKIVCTSIIMMLF